jgi:hypothetical protein
VCPDTTADIPDPEVVQYQQGTDPVGVRGMLLAQAFELAVQAPVVLLLGRGNACHRPHAPLARVIAHEHRQQLVAVKPVCLGAARTAVALAFAWGFGEIAG